MPTALGNALRGFEDTAGQRYGLETIPAFRRLYPLLSPATAKSYTTQRLQLDAAASMCVAFIVITGASAPALFGKGWWSAFPVTAAALAWVTYRGAITSALLMGSAVTTAFDLHRHDLIKSLHYPPRQDPALEYAFNVRLSAWLSDTNPDQRPIAWSMPDDYDHSGNVGASSPLAPTDKE